MNVAEHEQVAKLFLAARLLPDNERDDFLSQACSGDVALRDEVLALLNHDETRAPMGLAPPAPSISDSSTEGQRIGPYRLLKEIGQGGFGTVYLAQQDAPIRRTVAIKVINPGMDTRQIIARFEAERQTLANMAHPNIATVLDGGTTTGRPYFVMEFVEGEPITHYCDNRRLPIPDRLTLLTSVCDAVQHAHQKGIVHRDLKPSNVLVSQSSSGTAIAKIIDFGISKAVGQPLTERKATTRIGQLIGTPEYMSPEQASLGAMDVDTRTDVYALGVILYQLVAGALPFDSAQVHDVPEMLRVIREEDPTRPDLRLRGLPEAVQVAQNRGGLNVDTLARKLKGELGWIPLLAMHKDREKRYRSPVDLSDDIKNYLQGRPLSAGPESALYRCGKYARRHLGVVAAGSLAILALVAGLGLAAIQWNKASDLRGVSGVFLRLVATVARCADPNQNRLGELAEARELQRSIESNADVVRFREDMDQWAELAGNLSTVLRNDGKPAVGEPLAELALELRRRLFVGNHPDVAMSLNDLGLVRKALGAPTEALRLMQEAVQMYRGLGPANREYLATSLMNAASIFADMGQHEDAERLASEALEIQERRLEPNDDRIATSLLWLGNIRMRLERPADAEPLFKRALQIYQENHSNHHPRVAAAIGNLAAARHAQGQLDNAEFLRRQALDINQRCYSSGHPCVADSQCGLAETLLKMGRFDEAHSLFSQALEMRQQFLPANHPDVASSLAWLAISSHELGREDEAEALWKDALRIYRDSDGADQLRVAGWLIRLGTCRMALGKHDAADGDAQEAIRIYQRTYKDGHPHLALAMATRAWALHRNNRRDEARALVTQAEQMVLAKEPPEGPSAKRVLEIKREIVGE